MTVTVNVEVLEEMKREIEHLRNELKKNKKKEMQGFEKLDTDFYLTEVYN